MPEMPALEVVIVGAGRMGHEHAQAICAAGDTVMAFLDADPPRAARAASEYGALSSMSSQDLSEDLAQCAEHGATAVVIATPSPLHLEQAEVALSVGLPVLLEKPPWLPGQDPTVLLDLVQRGGVLGVGMTTRFNPGVQALHRTVRSGVLGDVLIASDRVAFTVAPGDLAGWYLDGAKSGGVLVTNGVHSLDRLAWILGQPLTLMSSRLRSDLLASYQDTAVLELAAGETAVQVMELWGPGPVPPSELLVVGSRGSCWSDAQGNWRLSAVGHNASEPRSPGYSELLEQWRSFRRLAMGNGAGEIIPSLTDLAPSMGLLEEALRS